MLVTEQMDIMAQCINILQEQGYIESNLTLRQAYNKYCHPTKLPLQDDKLWDAINSGKVLALFQLTSMVGSEMVKKLKPRNVDELTACNALIRLMPEGLDETPGDRYLKFKADISQWYKEMKDYGLSQEEIKILEKHCLADYGVPSSQEAAMLLFMDEDVCGFTLAESNNARRVISKKKMDKIPELREKVINQAKSKKLGQYVWDKIIALQMGYSFSKIHGFTYSLIGCQAAYLASYFPSVCWNTAYLRVISGLEDDASTNYGKVAKGVGNIIEHGIEVLPININQSGYMFEPDVKNNKIIFGMKGVSGINGDVIQEVVKNRPYSSFQDFMDKVKCNRTVMISLIKAGAFDQFDERKEIMRQYLWEVCEPKKRITMQNFSALIEKNMVPQELDYQRRLFNFNKALRKLYKKGDKLILEGQFYDFYSSNYDIDELEPFNNSLAIGEKKWKKLYDEGMKPAKEYIDKNKEKLLKQFNDILFQETWNRYANGNYSSWEMDSCGFYYHEHELKHIDNNFYNIVEFNTLPREPEIEYTFRRNGRDIPIFKTCRICGTVIAKEEPKSIIHILTPGSGVVAVKMNRDFFARINARLSKINADGTKTVMENGWCQKGVKLVLNGFRRGDTFVLKRYKKTSSHQCYRITDVNKDGSIVMTYLRWGETKEE